MVLLTRVTPLPLEVAHQFLPRLATFCILYSLALLSIHDADFYRQDTTGLVETAMFSQARLTEMCVLLRDAAVAITLVTHQRRASAKFWGMQREEEREVSLAELSFVLQVGVLCASREHLVSHLSDHTQCCYGSEWHDCVVCGWR